MKKRHPYHKGFTLAEVAIVFTIIGFIAAATIGVHKFKQNEIKKHMTFAAFQALKEFSGNNIADGNELITPGTPGTAAYDETQLDEANVDDSNLASSARYLLNKLHAYELYVYNAYYSCNNNSSYCSTTKEMLANAYNDYKTTYKMSYDDLKYQYDNNVNNFGKSCPRTKYILDNINSNLPQVEDVTCSGTLSSSFYNNDTTEGTHTYISSHVISCFKSFGVSDPIFNVVYKMDKSNFYFTDPWGTSAGESVINADNYLIGYEEKTVHHEAVPGTADTKTLEKALPETGAKLCEKAVDLLNIVGDSHCSDATAVNDASNFKTAIPSFKTPNSLTFYNVQANPSAGVAGDYSTQAYTIYIDIDGTNRGQSKLNDDVIKFILRRDGVVLPAADSIAANNTDYLTAAVKYENSWLGIGFPYRKAACQSGFIKGDYCLATGSYPAYAIATSCTAHFCNVYTSTPKLKFF